MINKLKALECDAWCRLHPQRKKMQKKGPNRLQSSVKRRGDGSGQFWGKGEVVRRELFDAGSICTRSGEKCKKKARAAAAPPLEENEMARAGLGKGEVGGRELFDIMSKETLLMTNLRNRGQISADRRTKPTLMLTIPRSIFKSSTKDLSLPTFKIVMNMMFGRSLS